MKKPIRDTSELRKLEDRHKKRLLNRGISNQQKTNTKGDHIKLTKFGMSYPIPVIVRKKLRDADTMIKLNKGL